MRYCCICDPLSRVDCAGDPLKSSPVAEGLSCKPSSSSSSSKSNLDDISIHASIAAEEGASASVASPSSKCSLDDMSAHAGVAIEEAAHASAASPDPVSSSMPGSRHGSSSGQSHSIDSRAVRPMIAGSLQTRENPAVFCGGSRFGVLATLETIRGEYFDL